MSTSVVHVLAVHFFFATSHLYGTMSFPFSIESTIQSSKSVVYCLHFYSNKHHRRQQQHQRQLFTYIGKKHTFMAER